MWLNSISSLKNTAADINDAERRGSSEAEVEVLWRRWIDDCDTLIGVYGVHTLPPDVFDALNGTRVALGLPALLRGEFGDPEHVVNVIPAEEDEVDVSGEGSEAEEGPGEL